MANEKRLIDANALKSQITRYHMSLTPRYISKLVDAEIGDVIDILDESPTADAVEVVHGRWKPYYETFDEDKAVGILGGEYHTGWQCSVCGRYEPSEEPYCNCGAKMDGGNENG